MAFDWLAKKQQISHRVDVDAGGIRFELIQGKKTKEFAEGKLEKIAVEDQFKFRALKNLESDEIVRDGFLRFEDIVSLDSLYRHVLGVGESSGWKVKIAVGSTIGKGQSTVRLHWRDDQGNPVDSARYVPTACGFWDVALAKLHVLPEPVLKIREQATPRSFEGVEDEYRFISELQSSIRALDADEQGNVELEVDQQLVGEDFIVPDVVDVAVQQAANGDLHLRPIVEGVIDFEDAAFLERSQGAVVSRPMSLWGRQRIALSESIQRDMRKIQSHSTVPKEVVARFLQNPAEFLGAEAGDTFEFQRLEHDLERIDLSLYSGRVQGVEIYTAPEVEWSGESTLGGGWFVGEGEEIPLIEPPLKVVEEALPLMREVLAVAVNDEELLFEVESKLAQFQKFGAPKRLSAETLYDHQKVGYVWLRNLWEVGKDQENGQGGLLADDMGLGKTLQVIALMAHLFDEKAVGPVLIVAPKTVLPNWEREIQRFVHKSPRIYRHEGSKRLTRADDINRNAVILTTFSTLRSDQLELGKVKFGLLVLDEAQNIKNYGTQQARAARAMQAQLRLALTATPVENRLEELWAIMDFAQPGLLNSRVAFTANFVNPIEAGGKAGESATQGLLQTMGNHYLRRTKEVELAGQLPKKNHVVTEQQMSAEQLEIYDAVRRWYVGTQQGPLAAISGLIMACAHPLAVNSSVLHAAGFPRSLTYQTSGKELMAMSAKFAYLREALEDVARKGEKAILFTRFKDLQLLLQRFLSGEFKINPRIVNGKVAGNTRQNLIDSFNNGKGFDCIILSTDAAGVGVNVTGANHVFHMTRPWNPAKEMQATDRAYRIGQKRDVTVHLPVVVHPTMNSLDKLLHELLESKRELATQVIRPSGSLDITWQDLEEGLGHAEQNGETISMLPTNLPTYAVPTLIASLLDSPVFLERLTKKSRVPAKDVAHILTFLDGRGNRASISQLAGCLSRDETRILRLVAEMTKVLNRDGYPVLQKEDGIITLNQDFLRQQFNLAG